MFKELMERNETIVSEIIEKYGIKVSKEKMLSYSSIIVHFQGENTFRAFGTEPVGKKWKQVCFFSFLNKKASKLTKEELAIVILDFKKLVLAYEQNRALKKALECENSYSELLSL